MESGESASRRADTRTRRPAADSPVDVRSFLYNVPMPSERALRARDVNALSPRTRTVDLDRELEGGRIGTSSEPLLDVLQRDRGSTTASRRLRRHVAELALQPHPSLNRRFANTEQLGELWIGALARLVGGNNSFTKCDRMTVNHHPRPDQNRIRNSRSADQIIRALGLTPL